MHVIFPAAESSALLDLVDLERLFPACFTTEFKQKLIKEKASCRMPILARSTKVW